MTAQQIEDALNNAYGTRQISTIYATSNEYQVIMEVKPEFQQDPSALGQLYIHSTARAVNQQARSRKRRSLWPNHTNCSYFSSAAGRLTQPGQTSRRLIPLSAVATFSRSVGPLLVNHLSQLPSATISFNLRPGVSLSAATDQVQEWQEDSAANDHDQLPGHRADLSIIAAESDVAAAGGGAGDLSGAGNSLRKFHSSADDSFGVAVGGFGRVADTVDVWSRAGRLRVRRFDHVDWHRREERDHDDRLCA